MITGIEKKVGKRLTRVYYHLESEGEQYYQKLRAEFSEYQELIQFLMRSKDGECYEGGSIY